MSLLLTALLVFFAALVQTLSGFGFALILMPLVTLVMGLRTTAPLVALVALVLNGINVYRYRKALDGKELLRLTAASALGVPVGVWALVNLEEALILRLMGLILVSYAIYSLVRPAAPRLEGEGWVYPAGFAAGCLGGAYNTPGPPVIVYASLRQLPKDAFRGVLHGLFFFNGVLVVLSHLLARNLTAGVLAQLPGALLACLLGIGVASRVDARLDRQRFRLLVTVLILILGLSMVLGLGQR